MTTLPTSLSRRFHTTFEGHEAAIFENAAEFNNFTLALKTAGVSFKTRINKTKRAGKKVRNFLVMLIEDTPRVDLT